MKFQKVSIEFLENGNMSNQTAFCYFFYRNGAGLLIQIEKVIE